MLRVNEMKHHNVDKLLGSSPMMWDDHKNISQLQTQMTVLQILFDVYKVVSVELHRRSNAIFMNCCPTCTNGYLMKEEYQSMIYSI